MTEFSNKRKYFRFPLFDDNEKVKIKESDMRSFLENDFPVNTSEEPVQTSNFAESHDTNKIIKTEKSDAISSDYDEKGTYLKAPKVNEPVKEIRKPKFYNDYQSSFEKKRQRRNQANVSEILVGEVPKRTVADKYDEVIPTRGLKNRGFIAKKIPESQVAKLQEKEQIEAEALKDKDELLTRFKKKEADVTLLAKEDELANMSEPEKVVSEEVGEIQKKATPRLEKSLNWLIDEDNPTITNKYFD